jgi:hypothetical protein
MVSGDQFKPENAISFWLKNRKLELIWPSNMVLGDQSKAKNYITGLPRNRKWNYFGLFFSQYISNQKTKVVRHSDMVPGDQSYLKIPYPVFKQTGNKIIVDYFSPKMASVRKQKLSHIKLWSQETSKKNP